MKTVRRRPKVFCVARNAPSASGVAAALTRAGAAERRSLVLPVILLFPEREGRNGGDPDPACPRGQLGPSAPQRRHLLVSPRTTDPRNFSSPPTQSLCDIPSRRTIDTAQCAAHSRRRARSCVG